MWKEDSKGCADPIPWHRDVPVTATPCLSPFLLKDFRVFPTSQGLSRAVGGGTGMKRGC